MLTEKVGEHLLRYRTDPNQPDPTVRAMQDEFERQEAVDRLVSSLDRLMTTQELVDLGIVLKPSRDTRPGTRALFWAMGEVYRRRKEEGDQ